MGPVDLTFGIFEYFLKGPFQFSYMTSEAVSKSGTTTADWDHLIFWFVVRRVCCACFDGLWVPVVGLQSPIASHQKVFCSLSKRLFPSHNHAPQTHPQERAVPRACFANTSFGRE